MKDSEDLQNTCREISVVVHSLLASHYGKGEKGFALLVFNHDMSGHIAFDSQLEPAELCIRLTEYVALFTKIEKTARALRKKVKK